MHGSLEVISHLIERGADVTEIRGSLLSATGTPPTRETLELLVVNGWDINRSGRGRDAPVLWDLWEDMQLVKWCLHHGDSPNPPDDTPPEFIGRMPILQHAAAVVDIATLELLRGQAALLHYDYGVLP